MSNELGIWVNVIPYQIGIHLGDRALVFSAKSKKLAALNLRTLEFFSIELRPLIYYFDFIKNL